MMLSRVSLIVAALFAFSLGVAGTVLAQTPPPAQPDVTPAPNCEKPGDPPRISTSEAAKEATERKRSAWSRNTKAYFDCLKHFIDEQQAAAAPHIRAANTAVEEYSKAIKTYNDQVEAARP